MTLNLTRVGPERMVVQATDRQTTLLQARSNQPISANPLVNKNLIYLARDAIVTIGYTGLATLQSRPSDQWIAELLMGQPAPVGPNGRLVNLSTGPLPRVLDIGQAVMTLAVGLDDAFRPLTKAQGRLTMHTIVIAGWQFWRRRRRVRPIVWEITNRFSVGEFRAYSRLARWWGFTPGAAALFAHPHENLPTSAYGEALFHRLAPVREDDVEAGLAAAIADVSNGNQFVGADAMVISVPMDASLPIRARFHPAAERSATFPLADHAIPIAFSPWVIRHTIVAPPALLGGMSPTIHIGPYRVETYAPPVSDPSSGRWLWQHP